MLRKIGNKLDAVEDEIFEGAAEEVVRDISNVKQEIINFRKVIRPQRAVLRDLENSKQRFLAPPEGEELEIYFDDIGDAHERIWDMLENYKEVVEALDDTNESVISHRVNEILRVLTSISVIVLPLTLVASIWGMNVGRPGRGRLRGLLRGRRRDGRAAHRDAGVLQAPRLALAPPAPVGTVTSFTTSSQFFTSSTAVDARPSSPAPQSTSSGSPRRPRERRRRPVPPQERRPLPPPPITCRHPVSRQDARRPSPPSSRSRPEP